MTESIPYPSKSTDVGVVIEMQKKSIPGSIEALGDLLVGTNVDPICQTGVTSLQWIILQCWDFDPTERPSSASILKDVAISFNAKTRSGDWGDGEAGISSLRIRDDFDYDGRASEGSVSSDESREIPLCANCQQHPKVEGREFCSRACLNEATSKRPNFGARAPNKYDLHDRNYRGGSGYRGSPSQGAASPYRASSLCINCQQHPKVKGRDFCSKACLNAAASLLTGSPKSDASGYHGFAGVAVPNVANSVQSPPYQVGNSREFAPIAYQGTGYADQAYQPIANWQQQRPPIAPAPQAAPQVLRKSNFVCSKR
ncbi:hypothetical protein M407DRAFT_12230 [Tulasnella calospora MUT 4182]|uniref:Uncharacterized protein n=1 Tax=Tulasnella calospora MUT 4182 TaxID=1051891 RepID=A0A0C3K8F1_9AGAM|nr:hypothetical protein M407DRAFT_12230 [Tulasnella calospora MUT 4182]